MSEVLREMVAAELARFHGDGRTYRGTFKPIYFEEADRILAIPEIAEALEMLREAQEEAATPYVSPEERVAPQRAKTAQQRAMLDSMMNDPK